MKSTGFQVPSMVSQLLQAVQQRDGFCIEVAPAYHCTIQSASCQFVRSLLLPIFVSGGFDDLERGSIGSSCPQSFGSASDRMNCGHKWPTVAFCPGLVDSKFRRMSTPFSPIRALANYWDVWITGLFPILSWLKNDQIASVAPETREQ